MTRYLLGTLLALVVVGCSGANTLRVNIEAARIANGSVTLQYSGSDCAVSTKQQLSIEGQTIYINLVEELEAGDCVLVDLDKYQRLELPDYVDLSQQLRIMTSRCVNESCSQTEFMQIND